MSTQKIVEKIQKLLALAGNNPNPQEAQAAMLKAQALMAEYNVEVSDTEEKIEYSLEMAETPMNNGYRIRLSQIIAKNFRCEIILMGNTVCFLGRKSDAVIAKQTFEFAYKYIRKSIFREQKKARDTFSNSKGIANDYCAGFLSGLQSKFDEQCRALMIVTPPDVKEEFSRRFPNTNSVKRGMRNRAYNDKAYQSGYVDGRSFGNSGHIEG